MTEGSENSDIVHLPPRFIADDEYAYIEILDEIKSPTDVTDDYIVPTHQSYDEQRYTKMSYGTFMERHYTCKQMLFSVIGGCFLTSVVVATAVYVITKLNYETDESNTSGKGHYLPLKFDKSTLHKFRYISENGLKLSNVFSRDTPVSSVKNPNTLFKYEGVIGDRCINRNSKIYFEVQYAFSAVDKYEPKKLIFEVGLAEREQVDNHFYVGTTRTTGWSYDIHTCNDIINETCLTATHGNDRYTTTLHHQLSQGSNHSGIFRFTVNTNQETFSVTRNLNNGTQTVHSFRNVFSVQGLCPTFGVYNPGAYEVKLSLLKTYDFSEAIWNVVIL